MVEKEFGKYYRDDLLDLMRLQKSMVEMDLEMPLFFSGKLDAVMPDDFSWLQLYEIPFMRLVATYCNPPANT
ncbi:hypothetical protein IB286_14540 [Spongiibacter sp. KMU-158]|uniref:Uncharacterized protein n=1 Tax=Spongiibacter pelagi TaxID=2760804 RepID=A0A927C614_9GAMM|nr:hypothetical protein [Spongiibacter pelagi]MBD2860216.1 hypothetical protein [Spongiibacter pelagi]